VNKFSLNPEDYLKKSFVLIISLLILISSYSLSQDKKMGTGIILGEPSGFSFKYWLTEKTALDAGLAWSFIDENAFQIQADYLVHNFNLIKFSDGKLPFYFGIGGRLKFSNDVKLGVRVPLGLTWIFNEATFDVFFEAVPILDLLPETDFTISAAIGGRYFFNF
jgi:hypothetical protein